MMLEKELARNAVPMEARTPIAVIRRPKRT
jgi:hypothetical protein